MATEYHVPNYQATPEELKIATAMLSASAKAADHLSKIVATLPRNDLRKGETHTHVNYYALDGVIHEAIASANKEQP
jgi:hypothetical protein